MYRVHNADSLKNCIFCLSREGININCKQLKDVVFGSRTSPLDESNSRG